MNKIISLLKTISKTILIIVLILITLLIIAGLLLRIPAVQKKIAGYAALYVSNKTGTGVDIKNINLSFNGVSIKGLFLEDKNNDTLLYAGNIEATVSPGSLLKKNLNLTSFSLQNARLNVFRTENDSLFSFDFLTVAFGGKKDTVTPEPAKKSEWTFDAGELHLNDIRINLADYYGGLAAGLNLNNLTLKMSRTDLDNMIFDIDELVVDGLKAAVFISKKSEQEEEKSGSISPGITIGTVNIRNSGISYADSIEKQDLTANIGMFSLKNALADLENRQVKSDEIILFQSSIKLNVQGRDTASGASAGSPVKQSAWKVAVKNINLDDNSVAYNVNDAKHQPKSFDPEHLVLNKLYFSASGLFYSPEKTEITVNKFTADAGNGFSIKKFTAKFMMDQHSAAVENLAMEAGHSSADADIRLNYPSVESFKDSLQSVVADMDFRNITISNSDVLYFIPGIDTMEFFKTKSISTVFSGRIIGPVKDLAGREVQLRTGNNTLLKADLEISGLPDFRKAYFNIKYLKITTVPNDIMMVAGSSVPSAMELPDDISLDASFRGTMKAFESSASLNTSYGSAAIDASVSGNENFRGRLNISDFDLGRFLKNDSMYGPVSMVAEADGQGFNLKALTARINAGISSMELNRHYYHDLNIAGNIAGSKLSGNISLKDESADFDLDALVNMNPDSAEYRITFDLRGADLRRLNFSKEDLRVALKFDSKIKGASVNDLNGIASLSSILVAKNGATYNMDSVKVSMVNEPGLSELNIKSPVIDLDFSGNMRPEDLPKIPLAFIQRYFSFQHPDSVSADTILKDLAFKFTMQLYDHPMRGVLFPQIKELTPATVTGSFDAGNSRFELKGSMDRLVYGPAVLNDISIDITSDKSALKYSVRSNITGRKLKLDNFLLEGVIAGNKVSSAISSTGANEKKKFMISPVITKDNTNYRISLDPSDFFIIDDTWNISRDNYILAGRQGFLIHNFSIGRQGSGITVSSVHDKFNDDLSLEISNLNLEDISGIIKKDTALLKGTANGSMLLRKAGNTYGIIADVSVNDLAVTEVPIGNLTVKAKNPASDRFDVAMDLTGEENNLSVNGFFITKDQNPLSLTASVRSLSMKTVKVFSMGALKEASGSITGDLRVDGNAVSPEITGRLMFNNALITPAALNTRLSLAHESIDLKPDGIYFNSFNVLDSIGNKASVSGSVKMNNFRNFAFDLQVTADDFLLFNTSSRDNKNYYGRLIIDSRIGITGPLTLPVVNARLKMKKDSYFTFAVPEKKLTTYRGEDVVQFEAPSSESGIVSGKEEKAGTGPSGFDITSVIEVDEQATLRVLLDPETADSLVVKGKAALSLTIDPGGKMSLTGAYNLNEGSYVVSLQSLIKRKFDIKKGSTITWNGDPVDADVSIDAVYSVRASPVDLVADQLSGLSQDEQNSYRQSYPFTVLLKLRGAMMNPEISFGIQLADEDKGILGGSVNAKLNMLADDPSSLNKQVFALLVLGRFVQENPFQTDAASSAVRSTVGKFLADQLNQWSRKLLPGVELNFDIQSYNDYASGMGTGRTQVDVGVKKQLFNERLSVELEGVVDVEGERARQNTANDITSDVTVEYKLTDDGRFRLRGFRHNKYEGALEGQIIETGAGLLYVRDYNRWKYFFRKRQDVLKTKKEE